MTVANSSLVRPIGLLGGTFDPIHLGHLYLATELYQRLNFQEVRFIPCYQSALKNHPIATAEQRLKLVELACQGHVGLVVDDREIRRERVSYTYDTLISLRQELGAIPLCLLMATDVFSQFTAWQHWQEVITLAHLVVVRRPGFKLEMNAELRKLLRDREVQDIAQLSATPGGAILCVDFPQYPISATEIRQRIATQQNVDYLLPEAVWRYIQEQKIYSSN
jgi:nicotinate-nucleotide adenylyltransferase